MLGVLCALCGEGAGEELTTEDTENTEGGKRGVCYNDGSEGSEGGRVYRAWLSSVPLLWKRLCVLCALCGEGACE
jgi:hypothetical protein